MALFGLALVIFAITRFVGLEDFPIYFFTDEANQTVEAASFVDNGFRDHEGRLFPTYFPSAGFELNESFAVYAQILPHELFGSSVLVARSTGVLFACLGMVATGLILRDIFKIRFWWIGVLLLSVTPAWFLHSRTSFNLSYGVSLYIWFLYFYMRYRRQQRFSLFFALPFGAMAFFTYAPMQIVVVTTGFLLLLSDLRYHLRNWRITGLGVLFLIVLALPYLRFQLDNPTELTHELRLRGSYWVADIPFTEKLQKFGDEYIVGLDPTYWYDPNELSRDGPRHTMKGYGNILLPTLPFAIIGALICLRNIRSSAHRTVLIALAAAPTGGAMVAVGVTRALVIVVPVALLTAIGLAAVLALLTRRIAYRPLAIGVFTVLGLANLFMLRDALTDGPTWYTNYGLYGMQYGAKQVFGEIKHDLQDSPDTQVIVSPNWTNGFDTVLLFFLPNEPRVRVGNLDNFNQARLDLNDNMLFVLTRDEYQTTRNPKFANIRVEKIIKNPDGTDAFFFVRLNYSPQADAIIAAETEARTRPVQEDFTLAGQTIATLHSQFGAGIISHLFDGNIDTLVRTDQANPAVIELTFPQPRPLAGLTVTTGMSEVGLTAKIYGDAGAEPVVYSQTFKNLAPDRAVDLNFDSVPQPTKRIRIEVLSVNDTEFGNVHVREIVLR